MSDSMVLNNVRKSLLKAVVLVFLVLFGWSASPDVAEAQLYNPCPYVNDGDCDEPNGLGYCAWGTDTADCSNPNSNYGGGSGYSGGGGQTGTTGGGGLYNPCPYVNDGDCDEPNGLGYCAWGTDTADCSNPNSNFGYGSGYAGGGTQPSPGGRLMDPCPYVNDGDCDEPNGLGYCAWGTDMADCSNPNANFGGGSGFRPGSGGNVSGGGSVQGGMAQGIDITTDFFGDLCIPGMRPFTVERGRQAVLFQIADLVQTSQRACPGGTGAAISVYSGSGSQGRQIASINLREGGAANQFYALVLPAGAYMLHFTYPYPARLRVQYTVE